MIVIPNNIVEEKLVWQMGFLFEPKVAFIVTVIIIVVSKRVSKVVIIIVVVITGWKS